MIGVSLPLMLLPNLSGLPAAHGSASSSLFNYLKSTFCTTSQRRGRISAALKCLLFMRREAAHTLRSPHPSADVCQSFGAHCPGERKRGYQHHPVLQAQQKRRMCSTHWVTSSEDYFGQQKTNPASYDWFHHSKLFSFPWLKRIFSSNNNKVFRGQ